MSKIDKVVEAVQSPEQLWENIEAKHFGPCVWQQRTADGRRLLEGLIHKKSGKVLIVSKIHDKRLPREGASQPWPKLIGIDVYTPIDRDNMSWEGLEEALTELK